MVRVDFWNNPLVVSAMRLKYRRGSPGMTASLYATVLLCVGALLHYLQDSFPIPFSRVFLITIFAIQFVVGGFVAMFAVAGSINAEVVNRTLDFQRIVSLSPRQVLLGKMLGEPAVSYFLAMATFPLVVACVFLGGGDPAAVLLLYVQVATFTIMFAAIGLLNPLKLPDQKPTSLFRSGGSATGGIVALSIFTLPSIIVQSNWIMQNYWLGALLGSLTPIPSLQGLVDGKPFHPNIAIWNIELPSLLVAPWMQLAVAASAVGVMTRKLRNAADPAVPRPVAYLVLALGDFLVAGIIFAQWRDGESLNMLTAQFCLLHVILGLILMSMTTPLREGLSSWIWRFRQATSRMKGALLADRSPNPPALLLFCLIGIASYFAWVVLPIRLVGGPSEIPDSIPAIRAGLCSVLFLLSWGVAYQWFVALAGRPAKLAYLLMLLAMLVGPLIVGGVLHELAREQGVTTYETWSQIVVSLSPIAHYVSWISPSTPWDDLHPGFVASIYGLLLVSCGYLLHRWMRWQTIVVERKLAAMREE